jgi:HrpA-like RNA helicase
MRKAKKLVNMGNCEEDEDILDNPDSSIFNKQEEKLINITNQLPDEKSAEMFNEERYQAWHQAYPGPPSNYNKMPILEKKDEIISLIEENPFTIILGGTGCGKTTQVEYKTKQKMIHTEINYFKLLLLC